MTKRTYSRLISNRKQRIKIIDIRNSANFSTEWSMWFPVNVVFHDITYNPIYFINRALYLSCSNVSPAPTYRRYSRKKKKVDRFEQHNSWYLSIDRFLLVPLGTLNENKCSANTSNTCLETSDEWPFFESWNARTEFSSLLTEALVTARFNCTRA